MSIVDLYKYYYSKKEAGGYVEAPTLNFYPTTNRIVPEEMRDKDIHYVGNESFKKAKQGKGFWGDLARSLDNVERTRVNAVKNIESLKKIITTPIPMDPPQPDPRYTSPKYVPETPEEHNKRFWEEWENRYANTPRGYFNRVKDNLADSISAIISPRHNDVPPRIPIPRYPIK